MSGRRYRRLRQAAFHSELGGYIPAMMESQLVVMEYAPKLRRRADRLGLRKLHKEHQKDQRWAEAR